MKILVRAATALGRSARKQRNRFGTEITHCRTGSGGMTRSTRCAAACAIRRPLQDGQTPLPLHEKATTKPCPHDVQRALSIAFVEGKADLFRTKELAAFDYFSENLRLTAEDQELSARYREAGFTLVQINGARFHSKHNGTQDSLGKVLRKQVTYARGQAYVLLRHGVNAVRVTTRSRNARAIHRLSQLVTVAALVGLVAAGAIWPGALLPAALLVVARCAYYFVLAAPMPLGRRCLVPFMGLAADACYTLGMVQGVMRSLTRG